MFHSVNFTHTLQVIIIPSDATYPY